MVAGDGAWSGSGDAAPVYECAGGGIGWSRSGDAAVSISLYGGTAEGSGQAGGTDGDGCGGGARGALIPDSRSRSKIAGAGGRGNRWRAEGIPGRGPGGDLRNWPGRGVLSLPSF